MKNNIPLVNKIIILNSNKNNFNTGDFVTVNINHIYIQDGNSHKIYNLFKKYKFKKIFNKKKISFFFDHSVLSINNKISSQIKKSLIFAKKIKANIFYRGEGISHILAIEKKIFKPNKIILGSDSHTCTGGIFNCLSLGMGASDIALSMITGKTWIKVPETLNIKIIDKPNKFFRSKDLILYILKKYNIETFLYKSIEISGKWIKKLSTDSLITISSMIVELGAKCIFISQKNNEKNKISINNSKHNLSISIKNIIPQIAKPHYHTNVVSLTKLSGQKINYVFIGSCTNSSFEDLKEVSNIFKKNKINKNVHCIVTPGSKYIYLKLIKNNYIKYIIESGAIITPPGCGPCIGTQGTIPANGDNILSTMNRNFKGRMGNPKSNIYISSPLIAAYTACLGRIPYINELE